MRTLQRRQKVHLDTPRSGPLRLTDAATLALSRPERDRLADQWRRAAVLEHGQADAFGDLACRLRRRGAPVDIVARCESAADLGLERARRCLELASRFAGHDISAGHLRRRRCPPLRRSAALARLARDASALQTRAHWYLAWLADQGTRRPGDLEVRAALALLTADDGRAELCADVVVWCSAMSAPVPGRLEDLARLDG
jgi:hypothetical protein